MPVIELRFEQVKELVNPEKVNGSYGAPINKVSSLGDACVGDLSFLGNMKNDSAVSSSNASIIILPLDYEGEPKANQCFFFHKNPSWAMDLVCSQVDKILSPKPPFGIHPTAIIHESVELPDEVYVGPSVIIEAHVQIGKGTMISAHSYIGRNVKIGEQCNIHPRATIQDYCEVGNRCTLHSGSVIGSVGFGYETIDGKHCKSPQVGIVVLEDDVDVGANSTIDRARLCKTHIGQGTKIDNLVQIAHNVVIGKGCFLAAQVGIAGSTIIGDYVAMGGRSGTSGHLKIGDFCQIAGTTVVYQDLPEKSFVLGNPAMPYMKAQKFNVLRKKLPDLFRRVSSIENNLPSDS